MQQTGSLSLKNSKNNVFYQASEPIGGAYAVGDTWFNTSNGFEMFRYTGTEWAKAGLTSAAFSTVEVGGASIGVLNSLLIFNDDDYWNLSDADIALGQKTYLANTLRTSHLIAEEDVYVDGGPGSYLKIPTENDEDSYVELSDGGMNVVSRVDIDSNTVTYTTNLPSYLSIADESDITLSSLSSPIDDFDVLGQTLTSTLEYNRSATPLDSHEYYDYTVTQGVQEMRFRAAAGTVVNDVKTDDYLMQSTYHAMGFMLDRYDFSNDDWETMAWIDDSRAHFGTTLSNIEFCINGHNITKIANRYIVQSGYEGAVSVRTYESEMSKYVGIGVNKSSKILYVYAGSSPISIGYVGRVALI